MTGVSVAEQDSDSDADTNMDTDTDRVAYKVWREVMVVSFLE
jgi:hypothetical protein